ncbi:MAG TPA: hypothetical protein VEV15_00320, partial [Flavisolibacter sp.]|nr:hypothetical protein [Flavisolibacter sp.]
LEDVSNHIGDSVKVKGKIFGVRVDECILNKLSLLKQQKVNKATDFKYPYFLKQSNVSRHSTAFTE